MALLSDYTAGTVTVSAGGTAVTGVGTAWQTAGFAEGDEFFAAGWHGIVQSVNSNTSLTLYPTGIRGAALAGAAYRLRYQGDGSRLTAQARQLIELLGGTGNFQAFAGLVGAADKMPRFTGAGTMTLDTVTAFMRTLLDDADGGTAYATLGQVPNAQVRADLTADKAFRRGNVLGTVSQTSGVPTGALIESGGNANGNYLRFANGTQICWGFFSHVTDIATAMVGGFRSPGLGVTFPAAFLAATTPAVVAGAANVASLTIGISTITETTALVFYSAVASQASANRNGYMVAFGRWF